MILRRLLGYSICFVYLCFSFANSWHVRLLLWQYIRVMIVYWLVIPHFDGAVFVYKHLICPRLTMDPQIVINWFNKRRNESSCIRESFLAELERYVQENGPEALERIVACKVSKPLFFFFFVKKTFYVRYNIAVM